ncbi:MAG: hypothetical protein KDA16_00400 [Phycisphaerales bacterium]|nr:hypothetical protein [Phycisphaerales bacterium]
MTRRTITLPNGTLEQLRSHLLPTGALCEEAAFLFTRAERFSTGLTLSVVEHLLIPPDSFVSRSRFYLELKDECRALVIKRAHDCGTGLIECHSHPGQYGACFSWSDLHGFDEFVPHVQWRLPGRPYAAIVFAADSIDAVCWTHPRADPLRVDVIHADGEDVPPTQFTFANWNDIYERSPI